MPGPDMGDAEAPSISGHADAEWEVLDVVDECNRVIGRELRSKCHRDGIRHRAAYCLLFNSKGELLMQRRSAQKKIGPLQWDLSVAEHLGLGESYKDAAERGLREELGARVSISLPPLNEPHEHTVLAPEVGIEDREFVQTFEVQGYKGDINIDGAEVCEVKWVTLDEVRAGMDREPTAYTEWFRREMALVYPRLSSAKLRA